MIYFILYINITFELSFILAILWHFFFNQVNIDAINFPLVPSTFMQEFWKLLLKSWAIVRLTNIKYSLINWEGHQNRETKCPGRAQDVKVLTVVQIQIRSWFQVCEGGSELEGPEGGAALMQSSSLPNKVFCLDIWVFNFRPGWMWLKTGAAISIRAEQYDVFFIFSSNPVVPWLQCQHLVCSREIRFTLAAFSHLPEKQTDFKGAFFIPMRLLIMLGHHVHESSLGMWTTPVVRVHAQLCNWWFCSLWLCVRKESVHGR